MNAELLSQISSAYMPSEALHDLVMYNPNTTHIKDAKTGAYILSNKKNLDMYDLDKPEQLIGLNVFDVDRFMRPYWGAKYAEEISNMDNLVKSQNKLLTKKTDLFLSAHGQIYVHDIIKLPLLGRGNKINSLLTISTDRTKEMDLFALLDLYRNMHPTQSIAIKKFMHYLDISKFFHEDLTYKELACLLHMRFNAYYKSVAKQLNISVKTVETHVTHIADKLKSRQLMNVLNQIRKDRC